MIHVRKLLFQFGRLYTIAAILTFTTAALLVISNLSVFGLREIRLALRPELKFPTEHRELYPDLEYHEFVQLHHETFDKAWEYSAYVGFRERARTGRFVNVSPEGFRYSDDRGQTLDAEGLHIYVFGGSTTFGYGVDDRSTIPACIQRHLEKLHPGQKIEVFNFGRAFYDSEQETIALLELIRAGRVPAVTIFLDGLNEGNSLYYEEEMREMFDAYNYDHAKLPMAYLMKTSTVHVINKLRDRLFNLGDPDDDGRMSDPETTLTTYLRNKEIILMLAREFGFETCFFIQPIPGYKNSFGDHPFMGWSEKSKQLMYSKMELLEKTTDEKTSFNLAAALDGYGEQPFVDAVHYNAAVCDLLAGEMARRIRLPKQERSDPPAEK